MSTLDFTDEYGDLESLDLDFVFPYISTKRLSPALSVKYIPFPDGICAHNIVGYLSTNLVLPFNFMATEVGMSYHARTGVPCEL